MNEYLTIFDNHSEYEKFTNTDKFIFPNVTCCVNNDDIYYNTDYPYEYVDMGLPSGTMWCTKNLGAVLPINDGNYYMYGDTTPYRRPNFEELFRRLAEFYNTNTDFSDEVFNERMELMVDLMWEKYSQYTFAKITSKEEFKNGGDEYSSSSFYTKYNMTDKKYELDSEDDPVVSTIGGNWKSPGISEIYELLANSAITLETINNKKVFVFTSIYNGNRLIFPIIYEGGGVPNDRLYLEDLKMSLLKSNALEPTYDNNHNLTEFYDSNVLLHLYYAITEPRKGPLTNPIVEYVNAENDGVIRNPIIFDIIFGDFFSLIQQREFPLPIRPIYVPPASIENMYKRFKNSQSASGAPIAPTYNEIDLLNDYIKNKFEADNNVDLDDPNYTGPTPRYINKTSQQNYIYFYTIGGSDDYDNIWYNYNTDEVEHSGNLCLLISSDYKYHHFALDSEYNIIDYIYDRYGGGGDIK